MAPSRFSSDEVQRQLLAALTFTKTTQKTIGDAKRLEEFAKIRKAGYATEEDEYTADTVALAVPIIDQGGKIRATLSLHGPSARFGPGRRLEIAGHAAEGSAADRKLLL